MTGDSDQLSPERAPRRLPDAQLADLLPADRLPVDGQLRSFAMPKATPGSLLRLREDGADLPITVRVPPRACMGDVITGRVYGL